MTNFESPYSLLPEGQKVIRLCLVRRQLPREGTACSVALGLGLPNARVCLLSACVQEASVPGVCSRGA
jgi:hypothetical protein